MSYSFQTNVTSLIAQENLRVNSQFQSQTITRLTSGFRINSSADDAAGLAVANWTPQRHRRTDTGRSERQQRCQHSADHRRRPQQHFEHPGPAQDAGDRVGFEHLLGRPRHAEQRISIAADRNYAAGFQHRPFDRHRRRPLQCRPGRVHRRRRGRAGQWQRVPSI